VAATFAGCSNRACSTKPFKDTKTYRERSEIPSCACGALIRPNIVWFNEKPMHMREVIPAIEQCSVFLTVGSSGVVQPAASFPVIAQQNGARTIYVGLESDKNKNELPSKLGTHVVSLLSFERRGPRYGC
jgi:NAD-dependent SIR2 family protein deacetylase